MNLEKILAMPLPEAVATKAGAQGPGSLGNIGTVAAELLGAGANDGTRNKSLTAFALKLHDNGVPDGLLGGVLQSVK